MTDIEIRAGRVEDFRLLAHHHYHPRPPRSIAHVQVALEPRSATPVGVLVVAMPVLNAAWRELAFPGRYRTGNHRRDARRLNDEVRTIARVVVDPRYRGMGVACRLVRHYLANPLTPVSEAVAAMGPFARFFENAGMRAYRMSPSARDLRLADAVASLGIDPWMLADPELIPARVLATPLLEREARRWANASRATRAAARLPLTDLLRRAARIHHPPTAYVGVKEAA